jgi:hypothetical protein
MVTLVAKALMVMLAVKALRFTLVAEALPRLQSLLHLLRLTVSPRPL